MKLKNYLVKYVGKKLQPSDENITTEMIVQVLAEEFPEFMLLVAEKNWLLGYEQAMTDVYGVEEERKLREEEITNDEK